MYICICIHTSVCDRAALRGKRDAPSRGNRSSSGRRRDETRDEMQLAARSP